MNRRRVSLGPYGLAAEGETFVVEVLPAGGLGEGAEFVEGKGAAGGDAAVVFRHGVAVDERGEGPDAEGGEPGAFEIRDEDAGAHGAAAAKEEDGVGLAEMVEGQGAVDEVVGGRWVGSGRGWG